MERGAATYGRGIYEINSSPGKAGADFDGDGKTDVSVFRPRLGTRFISQSSNNNLRVAEFGAPGDRAAAGDYDGNGKTDFAVFRPATSYWLSQANCHW